MKTSAYFSILIPFMVTVGLYSSAYSQTVDLRGIDPDKLIVDPDVVKGKQNRLPPLTSKPLTDKAHALTAKALDSIHSRGDYEAAIRQYKAALKEMPNDRGILIALSHTEYIRDKQEGRLKVAPNPKTAILLDALQKGKGDWERSIDFLNEKLSVEKDKDKLNAIREALNITRGIYEDIKFEKNLKKLILPTEKIDPRTRDHLRQGYKDMDKGNYENAVKHFNVAQRWSPHDLRINDLIAYAEGLKFNRYNRMKKWAQQQQSKYERAKVKAVKRMAQSQNALEKSQNALRLSEELNDKEAATISRKAIRIAKRAVAVAKSMISWANTRLDAVKKERSVKHKGQAGFTHSKKGKLYRKTPKGWQTLDETFRFAVGDELRTGDNSSADFVFSDGSTVQIGANSTLVLEKIRNKKSVYRLVKGRIHAEMSCLKIIRNFCNRRIHVSPNTVVSIRGTEFDIEKNKNGIVKVIVIDGVVGIINKKTGKEIQVRKGTGVVITKKGEVKGPVRVKLTSFKHWWEGETYENN